MAFMYLEQAPEEAPPPPSAPKIPSLMDVWASYPTWRKALSILGGVVGVAYGYKRHGGSVGWALGWSAFGTVMPFFAIPFAWVDIAKPTPSNLRASLASARRRR